MQHSTLLANGVHNEEFCLEDRDLAVAGRLCVCERETGSRKQGKASVLQGAPGLLKAAAARVWAAVGDERERCRTPTFVFLRAPNKNKLFGLFSPLLLVCLLSL